MDPNAALALLRETTQNIAECVEAGCTPHAIDVARAIEAFSALDNWMSNGGFLPFAWQNFRGLRFPGGPQHVITVEGPIAYPGGKDGTFRAICSAGDFISDFEVDQQAAQAAGDAHVAGVTS